MQFTENITNYEQQLKLKERHLEQKVFQMEEMYKKAHAAIRDDPSQKPAAPSKGKPKKYGRSRLSLQQRKDRVAQKKKAWLRKIQED